jgi:hypothetical protein
MNEEWNDIEFSRNEAFISELKALLRKYNAEINAISDAYGSYESYGPPTIDIDFMVYAEGESSCIELGSYIDGNEKNA